ncbi:MAG: thiazole synthase, partial [Polynucleobacter sp. 35-46-207]
ADDPIAMAKAFALSVQAGRTAYLSGAMQAQESAQASTPLVGTPFWHQS